MVKGKVDSEMGEDGVGHVFDRVGGGDDGSVVGAARPEGGVREEGGEDIGERGGVMGPEAEAAAEAVLLDELLGENRAAHSR